MTARTRTLHNDLHLNPRQKLGNRCFPVASVSAEAELSTTELPVRLFTTEIVIVLLGSLDIQTANRRAEARRPTGLLFESCLPPANALTLEGARHAAKEFDDNSHGVRLLSTFEAWAIVVPVYLTDTVRSQGFSPSQRFDPARTLWLCFTPHPPLGFPVAFRAFPSQSAGTPLDALCSPAVSASLGSTRANSSSALAPVSGCPSQRCVSRTILS
jgi:hypothetical protein